MRATDEDGNTDTETIKVSINAGGLVISESAVTVSENAGTAIYTVELEVQPQAGDDATVTITTRGDTAALTVDKTTLTFTSVNWDQPQVITVTGVDDFLENDDHAATIVHRSIGGGFTVAVEDTVSVTITNDDVAGLTLSVDSLTIPEGESATYTVALSAQPTKDITVFPVLYSGNANAIEFVTHTLTFTPSNWNRPQPVTVTAVDNELRNRASELLVSINHWGPIGPGWTDAYGLRGQATFFVDVSITDDDIPGVTFSKHLLNVDASGSAGDTYTVVLNTRPVGDVTITPVSADKGTKINFSPQSLTFTRGTFTGSGYTGGNWDQPQTITVTGIDTPDAASHISLITHNVSGADYGGVKPRTIRAFLQFSKTGGSTGLVVTGGQASEDNSRGVSFHVRRTDSSIIGFDYYTTDYTGDQPSATAGADYTQQGSNTQPRYRDFSGLATATIHIPLTNDVTDEEDEFFIVSVSPVGSTVSVDAILGILDDDGPPTLSLADATAPEDENVVFTITMSHPSSRDVTFKWKTEDDTDGANPATSRRDYVPVPASVLGRNPTVTIPAGSTTASLTVSVHEDYDIEEDETFLVTLLDPVNATLKDGASTATGTIEDNDMVGTFTLDVIGRGIEENKPYHGNAGVTGNPVGKITWALSGDDAGLFTLTPGSGNARSATFTMPAQDYENPADHDGNNRYELTVTASDEDNAVVSKSITVRVVDVFDFIVQVTQSGTVDEGEDVSVQILFNRAQNATDYGYSLNWAIEPDESGDHPAGTGDYSSTTSGAVSCPYGEFASCFRQTIAIPTTEDSLDEENETFIIRLTDIQSTDSDGVLSSEEPGINLQRAATATRDGNEVVIVITITDDDVQTAVVSLGDAAKVTEGDDSDTTVNMSFPVTVSPASGKEITLEYTLGGTADDSDYIAPSPLRFTVPKDQTTANILIPVKGDEVDELDETVTVTLTEATNATLHSTPSNLTGTGTITDDDAAELSVAAASAAEGDKVTFTITLDPVSDRAVTVKWVTANDADGDHPAGAGDYTAVTTAQTVTFAAGDATKTIEVQTTEDALDEENETFLVTLSAPTNAALKSNADQATGTITDDDDAPVVSVGNAAKVTEGDDSDTTVNMSFPVSLSAVSGKAVTVTYTLGGRPMTGRTTRSRTRCGSPSRRGAGRGAS